jgi:hypothetical protein
MPPAQPPYGTRIPVQLCGMIYSGDSSLFPNPSALLDLAECAVTVRTFSHTIPHHTTPHRTTPVGLTTPRCKLPPRALVRPGPIVTPASAAVAHSRLLDCCHRHRHRHRRSHLCRATHRARHSPHRSHSKAVPVECGSVVCTHGRCSAPKHPPRHQSTLCAR